MDLKINNIPNNTITRKLVDIDRPTGNVYKSLNIIRAAPIRSPWR